MTNIKFTFKSLDEVIETVSEQFKGKVTLPKGKDIPVPESMEIYTEHRDSYSFKIKYSDNKTLVLNYDLYWDAEGTLMHTEINTATLFDADNIPIAETSLEGICGGREIVHSRSENYEDIIPYLLIPSKIENTLHSISSKNPEKDKNLLYYISRSATRLLSNLANFKQKYNTHLKEDVTDLNVCLPIKKSLSGQTYNVKIDYLSSQTVFQKLFKR